METEDGVPFSIFWSKIIKPDQTVNVSTLDDCYLVISNICLGDLPENPKSEPVKLIAKVESLQVDEIDFDSKDATVKTFNTTLAVLIPGKTEHQKANFAFTPQDKVELTVKGPYPIHVSGMNRPISEEEEDDGYEEESVENEEEGFNEVEFNKKMAERISNIAKK